MKKTKSARRLILSKQTVAHLNDEQMSAARGGGVTDTCITCETCTKTGPDTKEFCTHSANGITENCS
ncbi:MAG: hypothetical protein GTO45_03935 [Candidatus Aminicenantes bacterium]|nr:hypothetical protein [Candidatus Aminicenantes bacterium]NIM77878.1 hypothetical protein [Candidatus Aminicenantes bacterium]NIN17191.1 hypothetical protein [Candidatus Aminicenantes bacterium]NIN41084.1 hypothetical protein [Candidatus Aminicenantes bacterium]NIN83889.1 hypothetical protein [Candidatus Aminicenantes bacterium]